MNFINESYEQGQAAAMQLIEKLGESRGLATGLAGLNPLLAPIGAKKGKGWQTFGGSLGGSIGGSILGSLLSRKMGPGGKLATRLGFHTGSSGGAYAAHGK